MKIPFDIKYKPQIESGEYKVVIEYDNRSFYARIVCWDFNSTELLACVNYGDREDVLEYDSSGKHIGKSVGRPDLIIITPEPELSKFEKKVYAYCDGKTIGEELIKRIAAELLELARKELVKEGTSKNEMGTMLYDAGFEDGKEEALKDLPRWEKATCELLGTGSYIRFVNSQHKMAYVESKINKGDWFIRVTDLVKLPGFKE